MIVKEQMQAQVEQERGPSCTLCATQHSTTQHSAVQCSGAVYQMCVMLHFSANSSFSPAEPLKLLRLGFKIADF